MAEELPTSPTSEGYVAGAGGAQLYMRRWVPPQTQAHAVLVHGGGEHSGRYRYTAARFNRDGLALHTFDLPGHGKSPGVRGHINRFDDFIAHTAAIIKLVTSEYGSQPVLFGHSLGGLICTYYAVQHPDTINCLVLSSPFWGLGVHVPTWKRAIARLLSPVWPSLTLARPKALEQTLTHDVRAYAQYLADPLVHSRASVRLYTETRARLDEVVDQVLPKLTVPVLVLQADDDRIASVTTIINGFRRIGSSVKRKIEYPRLYHELFNETEREAVWRDVIEWLRERGVLRPPTSA